MIIDLKHIFVTDNSVLPIMDALDLSDLEYMGEYPLKKPVEIVGKITNKASLVRLEAEIKFEFDASCDRCGTRTAKKHTLKVEKSLAPTIEGEDSDTILTVPDMKLDLDELLYTETVTNLPMKHLCDENCKGICQKCGKNLNEGECGCNKKEIDPRLQALADLLN
ncbi:MAG: DUF177 domain-containing protein [Clostridia bacterium]|nr:DUF177 domain-containing protein [Clostridia bacterium]